MSIQYTELGFEPADFRTRVSSHNARPLLQPTYDCFFLKSVSKFPGLFKVHFVFSRSNIIVLFGYAFVIKNAAKFIFVFFLPRNFVPGCWI